MSINVHFVMLSMAAVSLVAVACQFYRFYERKTMESVVKELNRRKVSPTRLVMDEGQGYICPRCNVFRPGPAKKFCPNCGNAFPNQSQDAKDAHYHYSHPDY